MQSNNSEKSNSSIFEDSGYLKEEELEEKGEEILFSNEESYFGDTSASQGAFLKKKRKFSKKYRKSKHCLNNSILLKIIVYFE